MNTETKLGIILDGPAERDAVHVAVVALQAGETLYRGQKVRLSPTEKTVALSGEEKLDAVGIVDPFIPKMFISTGTWFWCLLTPGTVTGMRHEWKHPLFSNIDSIPTKVDSAESLKWLQNFADKWNFDFSEMVEAATSTSEWRYVVAQGKDLHGKEELDPGDYDLFWEHIEAYTGQKFSESHREGMGWSCSC